MTTQIKTSPWGKVQHETFYAQGVAFVGTAGHGGIKLDRKHNVMIPAIFRRKGGWYEEDCEAAIPLYFLGDIVTKFNDKKVDALRSLKIWYWEEYEAYTGETVPLDESFRKREQVWAKENVDNYTVRSALNIGGGIVGVFAQKASTGETAWFRVPKEDYKQPFAVDLDKHEQSETPLF